MLTNTDVAATRGTRAAPQRLSDGQLDVVWFCRSLLPPTACLPPPTVTLFLHQTPRYHRRGLLFAATWTLAHSAARIACRTPYTIYIYFAFCSLSQLLQRLGLLFAWPRTRCYTFYFRALSHSYHPPYNALATDRGLSSPFLLLPLPCFYQPCGWTDVGNDSYSVGRRSNGFNYCCRYPNLFTAAACRARTRRPRRALFRLRHLRPRPPIPVAFHNAARRWLQTALRVCDTAARVLPLLLLLPTFGGLTVLCHSLSSSVL